MDKYITTKMIIIVLSTIGSVGAAAGYIEFRAESNASLFSEKVRQEAISLVNTKYNAESGIRLELLVGQQAKTLEQTVHNTQKLIELNEKMNTQMALFSQQITHMKEEQSKR